MVRSNAWERAQNNRTAEGNLGYCALSKEGEDIVSEIDCWIPSWRARGLAIAPIKVSPTMKSMRASSRDKLNLIVSVKIEKYCEKSDPTTFFYLRSDFVSSSVR